MTNGLHCVCTIGVPFLQRRSHTRAECLCNSLRRIRLLLREHLYIARCVAHPCSVCRSSDVGLASLFARLPKKTLPNIKVYLDERWPSPARVCVHLAV